MKIYVIEYDTFDFRKRKLHKIEKMFQYELEDRIELLVDNPYVSNIKRYEGELKEVDKFNISF